MGPQLLIAGRSSLNSNRQAADRSCVAATLSSMVNPDTTADGLPTRRELTVLTVILAVVIASVLLLIVASGQVAAALTGPS